MYKFLFGGVIAVFALLIFVAGRMQKDDGVAKIVIWHQKDLAEREFLAQKVAEYNKMHTDHQVEILYKESEELRSLYIIAAMGGKGPDLIYGPADNVGVFALTKTIRPIDDLFDANFYDLYTRDGFVRYQGKRWLVADQVGNHLTLVYNKKLVPNPPKTLSELEKLGQTLTKDYQNDGKIDQYALVWNYREPFFFVPFATGYGAWLMDDNTGKPTLNNEKVAGAVQAILDLRNKYKIIPKEIDYDTAEALFKDGKAAMVINGPWAWAGYGDAGVDYGISVLPTVDETGIPMAPIVSSKGYSVNINTPSSKMKYVKQVMTFLTGGKVQEEMAKVLSTVPVNKKALASQTVKDNKILQASLAQLKLGKPMPANPRFRQMWDGMRGPYQLVMSGKVSAQEGARLMQENCEKLIQDTYM